MKKWTSFKTLARSPLRTLLTFLLIAAAAFAFFSRVTEYAITTREAAKAKSFYSGVAALDTSVPPIMGCDVEEKPWPSDEQIEKFSTLPGVTLADTRYTTDGLIEDYKCIIDQDSIQETGEFIMEGTYTGLEETTSGNLYIIFNEVSILAGEIEPNPRYPMRIIAIPGDPIFQQHSYSRSFFDDLKVGGRYLVLGTYSEKSGSAFELGALKQQDSGYDCLRLVDGLGEDYLDTEEFAWYKGRIEARNQSIHAFDIVYTSDMRAIPYVNEHRLLISDGRPLTMEDTDVCVVSEAFLETYGLSVGDRIHIKLGDRLRRRLGTGGTRYCEYENLSKFSASAELEIVGAYRFDDDGHERYIDNRIWSYGPSTVFVPASLLPVEVPEDHEITMGDFSVFIQNPEDIEAFRDAAEPLAADMGVGMRFSDGGWMGMQDSFQTAPLISFLTTALYVVGAALALLLAVYLYLGRNKKVYAIMRTMGVTGKKAGSSIALPLGILSVLAMAVGGMAGLFHASRTAQKALAAMSDNSAPEGYHYVLDSAIPVGVVILCFVCELAFISLLIFLFLQRMKKASPLELLQEGTGRTGAAAKQKREIADAAPVPAGIDFAKLSEAGRLSSGKKYSALRQTCDYIWLHMRRGLGKTAVSFGLTVVLAAGIGMFVLARLAYQDAYRELHVKGVAAGFSSAAITELSKSELVKDLYYYTGDYNVRVNDSGVLSPLTFTNDFDRYLTDDYTITWAKGYDLSVFERTGAVCLMGSDLAESMGIQAGDEVTLMSDDLYSFMVRLHEQDGDFEFYKDEKEFLWAITNAGKPYQVAGILNSENEDISSGIFSVANDAAELLYSQPFQVGYCEFLLADNQKVMELNSLLEEEKAENTRYAPTASFHLDIKSLENVKRIRSLLESLFPVALASVVLIGVFGTGLLIMQSAREAAFLRILGVTKKRVRCIFVLEQVVLCMAGILLVNAGLALAGSGLFGRCLKTLAFCGLLYFLGCVCGALAAAIQVSRHRALELLQIKE